MKLTTKEIAFLAKNFEQISPLSLFANINQELSGAEEESLTKKGVYKTGKLIEELKGMFEIVATATNCSRIVMRDSFCVVEKYTYKAGKRVVLIENQGGDMLFSMPDDLEKAALELSEFTGASKFKSSDIEILLSADEMLTLFGMVDICRKKALMAYIGQEGLNQQMTLQEITKQLNDAEKNGIVQMLKKNYKYSAPQADKAKSILDSLIEKKCVAFEKGYVLTTEYDIFAKNFLMPETIVMFETLDMDENGEIDVASGLAVCAGILDIASFVFSVSEIEISSISGSQLLQMVQNFMECPDLG